MSDHDSAIAGLTEAADRDVSAPPTIDTTTPSIARVYNASLKGGKDYYKVDWDVWQRILAAAPNQSYMSQLNREWLIRVVRYLADSGLDQFLDVGSGLPTAENTHEVAQHRNPDARVVYVDNDPQCLVYGRALLEENERTHLVDADLTRPTELLAHSTIPRLLDFDRPIVLMQCGTLHHVTDEQDPAGIMRQYIDALPSGSYVMISHFWDPGDENPELHEQARATEASLTQALGLGSGWFRHREEIASLFGDLDMLSPGLVELHEWWPAGPSRRERYPEERLILGGVAYKP